MYFLLGRKKHEIRRIARRAYLNNPNNLALAKEQAEREIRTRSIVISILISIAVRLAIELIKYWFFNKVSVPAFTFQNGEPGS